jgi:hypothetical protein
MAVWPIYERVRASKGCALAGDEAVWHASVLEVCHAWAMI